MTLSLTLQIVAIAIATASPILFILKWRWEIKKAATGEPSAQAPKKKSWWRRVLGSKHFILVPGASALLLLLLAPLSSTAQNAATRGGVATSVILGVTYVAAFLFWTLSTLLDDIHDTVIELAKRDVEIAKRTDELEELRTRVVVQKLDHIQKMIAMTQGVDWDKIVADVEKPQPPGASGVDT